MQPKQWDGMDLITDSAAVVVGIGGGRGAAKSSGADRILITLGYEQKDMLACIVMRTWPQVEKYHLEPFKRDFPWLEANVKVSIPANVKFAGSQIDFAYAKNYDEVEKNFRSANYRYIIVDQAEQFSERELREMRKACRSKGKHRAKFIMLFNMRGASISTLRKWFHTKEYNKDESPQDYVFLKVNPWDNIEWVRSALDEDGYTEFDYYAWTDEQRKHYAGTRGEYTRMLATDDEVIRKADWEGDWDSMEGAYFANTFDLESTRIGHAKVEALRKPWANHWMSQDWGKAHWCSNHWHFRVTLSPLEIRKQLGWEWPFEQTLNVTVTYREMLVSELTSTEVARKLIDCTPEAERPRLKGFFGSPDAFGERDSVNTIASQQSKELKPYGMPGMTPADNDRKGGWGLMGKMLRAAKWRGVDPNTGKPYPETDVWLISSECPELLKSLPMAMRDPKDIDDVLKTDKGQAKIEQDVLDDVRYGLKTMLAPRRKTEDQKFNEKMATADPAGRMMLAYRQSLKKASVKRPAMPPSWKGNVR